MVEYFLLKIPPNTVKYPKPIKDAKKGESMGMGITDLSLILSIVPFSDEPRSWQQKKR